MSSYSDMHKDAEQAKWIRKWVPEPYDELPEPTPEQYRFTMARARSAEAQLADTRKALTDFRRLLGALP